MAVNELWFRQQIPSILKFNGGSMTKVELVDFLMQHYQFDAVAMSPYPSRSRTEPRWHQLLGNVVSHSKSKVQYFPEGFIVYAIDTGKTYQSHSKQGIPKFDYVFSLQSPDQQVDVPPNGVMMNLINNPKRKDKASPLAQGIDMSSIAQKKYEVGLAGEDFVYRQERDFILSTCPNQIKRLVWTARDCGDGFGYDIQSVQHNDIMKPLYIEVKATVTGDGKHPSFHISKNEDAFMQSGVGGTDRIIRYLYNANDDWSSFDVLDISPEMYITKFNLVPQDYVAKFN